METIVQYFSSISSLHRLVILASGIAFFWILETAKPMFNMRYKKWHHAGINLFFTTTIIVVNFVMALILLKISAWSTIDNFGILRYLPTMNFWVYALVGLLLIDLISAYLPHYEEHNVNFLWRFHLVHYTDTFVDTTTANRHHPTESAIRFVFTTIAVVALGAPIWLVFLYQTLSVIATQFNHANIALPQKIDRFLS